MKVHWKEICEIIKNMNKNFAVRSIYIVISIFLMCCSQKGNDVRPTRVQSEIKPGNEGLDASEEKKASIYRPSDDHYDNIMKTTNAEDEYNDCLDDYLDDPEDELRFDPEIFDFQDD